jgi:hypothetical protein
MTLNELKAALTAGKVYAGMPAVIPDNTYVIFHHNGVFYYLEFYNGGADINRLARIDGDDYADFDAFFEVQSSHAPFIVEKCVEPSALHPIVQRYLKSLDAGALRLDELKTGPFMLSTVLKTAYIPDYGFVHLTNAQLAVPAEVLSPEDALNWSTKSLVFNQPPVPITEPELPAYQAQIALAKHTHGTAP